MEKDPESIKEILDEKIGKLENNQSQSAEIPTKGNPEGLPIKGTRGGPRPGGGRPKGKLSEKNRTAQEAKKYFVERVHANVEKLFDAQLDLATGEKILMVKVKERDDDGKVKKIYHEIVEDKETIRQFMDNEEGTPEMYEELNDEDHYYYLTVRPANNQALQGMLDRAFGKAPEKIEIEGGFFKQDTLKIEIINPETKTDNGRQETTSDSEAEHETEPSA